MTFERIRTGRRGEQIACDHLAANGYRLIARNFRTREGEIDLIAALDGTLVVCEVKTLALRGKRLAFSPLESITPAKRSQVRRMTRIWLSEQTQLRYRQIRFDAIGVILDPAGGAPRVVHVESAF